MTHPANRRAAPASFVLLALLAVGSTAAAQYPVLSGQIATPAPLPASLDLGDFESNAVMAFVPEQADFVVPTQAQYAGWPIHVDLDVRQLPAGSPIAITSSNQLLNQNAVWLDAGDQLDVWLVHHDKVAGTSGTITLNGSIDFGAEIVAIQVRKRQLDRHDGLLGAPGIQTYATGRSQRGLELGASGSSDHLVISADHSRLDVQLSVASRLDELRIFTRPYTPAIQTYCFGEGGCPCANDAPAGSGRGCANSASAGGLLSPQGTNVAASDDLSLSLSGLPSHSFGLLFMGEGQSAAPVTFGEGRLCVQPGPNGQVWGQGFKRVAVGATGPQGAFTVTNVVGRANQLHGAGTVVAGTTWHFQGYYRDPAMTGCGQVAGYNLTNALSVAFQ